MNIYIPPQLKRLSFFLLIIVTVFIFGRRLLVPETFGDLGHYRASSLLDNEKFEPIFAGHTACLECHQDIAESLEYDLHSDISCETCHGPGYQHTLDPGSIRMSLPSGRDFCGTCHSQNAARAKNAVFQVNMNDHNTEFDCKECHNPHQPWDLKN
jgi:hypothetical protein